MQVPECLELALLPYTFRPATARRSSQRDCRTDSFKGHQLKKPIRPSPLKTGVQSPSVLENVKPFRKGALRRLASARPSSASTPPVTIGQFGHIGHCFSSSGVAFRTSRTHRTLFFRSPPVPIGQSGHIGHPFFVVGRRNRTDRTHRTSFFRVPRPSPHTPRPASTREKSAEFVTNPRPLAILSSSCYEPRPLYGRRCRRGLSRLQEKHR